MHTFAHVSCLARQAKILVEDAEARDLDDDKWDRWYTCGLCEQTYHGVVYCALGWACWKTYVGRPEADELRGLAMNVLGGGLYETGNYAGALAVMEADLSMKRRLGASERSMLAMQGNLASTYERVGRKEEALSMERNVYSGHLKLNGEEHEDTVIAANNYASSLIRLEHSEEAKALLRKTMPVAQRVLGESHETMLNMRWLYAAALSKSTGATLNDIREAATTLEETERTARRVLGSAHPLTKIIERNLRIVQDLVNRQGLSKK